MKRLHNTKHECYVVFYDYTQQCLDVVREWGSWHWWAGCDVCMGQLALVGWM